MKSIGLTDAHAAKLLSKHGQNEITGQPRQTPLSIFVAQFTSILVILLIFASLASLFLGDVLDGLFILLIVILNGILGFVQEYRAENAIAALKKMTVTFARVIRSGVEVKIDSKLLVPGDVVRVEEGDNVPADCRLLPESYHLEANESSLTGESIPVEKNPEEEGKQHIFMGTTITHGRAMAEVIATGMSTKFGSIAASLSSIEDEATPLEKKIALLGKQLGALALTASVIVLVIGFFEREPIITMLLASISLAVAAVPEGLPAVITITLAVGTQRMARKKAILRKLSAIEALGSTTIIATDKTGTLTKNQMRVTSVWTRDLDRLITTGVLCNNANLAAKNGGFDVLGDTTEGALLLYAVDKGVVPDNLRSQGTLIEEYGFDPVVKRMSVAWKKGKTVTLYTKGAPEGVLANSTHFNGKPITLAVRKNIEKEYVAYANMGLRVIAFASRTLTSTPKHRDVAEQGLTFLGFVGISDPPREEVKDAIAIARAAGIRTIMITGDNELTARAIGKHIGLMQKGDEVVTGAKFARLTDEEAMAKLPSIRILARTAPDEKLRVVRLLQRMGHVVSVTGDGVNDALALKQADVGVAMGITGTDVAKEAAEMVITDDNYATIVTAVEEGRTIFDNIKAAIQYLVGCNIGEIMAVLIGMLLGWPLILSPLQLLYINLVTDGLPAIALAITPKREAIMKRAPRTGTKIFTRGDFLWFGETSLLTTVATLIAFFIGFQTGNYVLAQTLAFTTLILVQHFILLDVWVRERSVFQLRLYKNTFFLFTFFAPLLFQAFLLFSPALSRIFKVTAITPSHALIITLLSFTIIVSSEARKFLPLLLRRK